MVRAATARPVAGMMAPMAFDHVLQMRGTIARKGRSYLARMIWRHANRVGLAFKAMVTDQGGWVPQSAFLAQGLTPTSGKGRLPRTLNVGPPDISANSRRASPRSTRPFSFRS